MKKMTVQEFASLGGKARWANVPKLKIREHMKNIASKPRKKLSTPTFSKA